MKILKRISTKARIKCNYELEINWHFEYFETLICKEIQLKAFGLLWISYIRYTFTTHQRNF